MADPVYGYKRNYARAEVIPMSELDGIDLTGGVPPVTAIGPVEISGDYSTWSDDGLLHTWTGLPAGVYMALIDGYVDSADAEDYGATPSAVALSLTSGADDWGDYETWDTALCYSITNQSTIVPVNRACMMATVADGAALALRLIPAEDTGYYTVEGDFAATLTARLYRLR